PDVGRTHLEVGVHTSTRKAHLAPPMSSSGLTPSALPLRNAVNPVSLMPVGDRDTGLANTMSSLSGKVRDRRGGTGHSQRSGTPPLRVRVRDQMLSSSLIGVSAK